MYLSIRYRAQVSVHHNWHCLLKFVSRNVLFYGDTKEPPVFKGLITVYVWSGSVVKVFPGLLECDIRNCVTGLFNMQLYCKLSQTETDLLMI